MNRRDTVLALVALGASPLAAKAQQAGKVWRVGFLSSLSGPNESIEAFRDQLRILGYIEGRNLSIEYRWSAGADERLPEMAAELVQLKVDVIVTHAGLPPAAAKRATSTIPIVTAATADPVGQGLVAVLAMKGTPATPLLLAQMRTVAQQMGLTLLVQEINEPGALASAFAAMQRAGAQLLIVQQSPFTAANRKIIVELAAKALGLAIPQSVLARADEVIQ